MSESIWLHLNPDFTSQKICEEQISPLIARQYIHNLQAFRQHMPNLYTWLESYKALHHGILVDKQGTLNISMLTEGVVLYPTEASKNLTTPDESLPLWQLVGNNLTKSSVSAPPDILIIVGIGLGLHLLPLIQKSKARFVIIYESEADYLSLSLFSAPWERILNYCQLQQVQLFIQYGPEQCLLEDDLQELTTVVPNLQTLSLYRHLCCDVLDKVIAKKFNSDIRATKTDQHEVLAASCVLNFHSEDIAFEKSEGQQHCFKLNLEYLRQCHPALYERFRNFIPNQWLLVNYRQQDWMYQPSRHRLFSAESINALSAFSYFREYPLLDPVAFGQKIHTKFHADLQYGFHNKINEIRAECGSIPVCNEYKTRETILVGLGSSVVNQQAIATSRYHMFVEASDDIFYASLYTTPWYQTAGENCYFVVGDSDITEALQKVYLRKKMDFIDCFFHQAYYSQRNSSVYKKITEVMHSTNGKANYFEAVWQDITQLTLNLTNAKFLLSSKRIKENCPVIVVGNGPSLDRQLTQLKTLQHEVVIISCGTALRALYQAGIKPDFHAELEKSSNINNWLNAVDDNEYLKEINFLGLAHVHNSVSSRFKSSYLMFAAGEGCTRICRLLVGSSCFFELQFATYSVVNLVLNFLLEIDVNKIYLMGVDLGFKDPHKHHSVHSAHFKEDGRLNSDFHLAAGASMKVRANFGGFCYSVADFNAARLLLENRLRNYKNSQDRVFNCSDGAFVAGTTPLNSINLLNFEPSKKNDFLVDLEQAFATFDRFELIINMLSPAVRDGLKRLVRNFLELFSVNIDCSNRLLEILARQREMLDTLSVDGPDFSYELFNGSLRYFETKARRFALYPAEQWQPLLVLWQEHLEALLHLIDDCPAYQN